MPSPLITEFAAAKVNLCLHVTGQRADGYHLLDSVVAFAGIGDKILAQRAGISSLTLEGPYGARVPTDTNNSVLRAASYLFPDSPVAFTLTKHLPPASGIGGGSADAAAALRAVIRLAEQDDALALDDAWFAQLERRIKRAELASLGADLSVCMLSHPARMRGIGSELDLLPDFPAGGIVLANPGVEVPTPDVFKTLVQKDNPPLPAVLPSWPDVAALADWLRDQRNDLEPAAIAIAPVIAKVRAELARQPGALIARMSGSGATCFALFASEGAAEAAAKAVQTLHPEWWVADGPLYPGRPGLVQLIRATT